MSRVAYVLKGYPRLSELFIASEIHRLEQLGVDLALYVVKQPDEEVNHPVVDRIRAVPRRLPEVSSISKQPLHRWLRRHLRQFVPAIVHAMRRHPVGTVRAAWQALAQSVRARRGWRLRRIYCKEFLQALSLVHAIDQDGGTQQMHAHFAHGTTTVTWLASIVSGVPFSFTAHAKDIYEPSLNPAGLLARKMRAAEFVTTCTGANHTHLRDVAPDCSVELVYHGLNSDFSQLLGTAPQRTAPERFSIVSVGRQVPKKGFDVLIAAVRVLVDRDVDVALTIAGESGSEHDALRRQVAETGLGDHVSFIGTVTQEELLDLYLHSSAFALACRIDDNGDRDGIPNVLVEAMAAGLPVVSTSVSGIPEVVEDGVTGLLVAPEDPDALADALHRLVKDPVLGDELGSAAAALVASRFDGDVLARRLVELIGGVDR